MNWSWRFEKEFIEFVEFVEFKTYKLINSNIIQTRPFNLYPPTASTLPSGSWRWVR